MRSWLLWYHVEGFFITLRHINLAVMETEYVVGIGELLWDMLPGGRRLGGAPANFAYHVSQFGLKSVVVSAVGDDEAGDAALEELSRRAGLEDRAVLSGRAELDGAELGRSEPAGRAGRAEESRVAKPAGGFGTMISRVGFPTGTVGIELDAAGVPQYDIRMPVAWDNIPFTPALKELASRTRAVCFGTLARRCPVSRSTVSEFVDAVPRGEGQWRIFDINLREQFYSRDIVLQALEQCNILKINDEELETVTEMLDLRGGDIPGRCRDLMNRHSLEILILTCGVHGSYVFSSGDAVSFLETPKVEVADTVGAGDSFTAAFTAALLRGKPVSEAHRLAVDVSAYVCTCEGAMPVLPESLLRRLRQ